MIQATVRPESIEGFFEGYLSAEGVFDRLQAVDFEFDALVMAGFGEPGREGAQELLEVPVFDITECAALVACLLGRSYVSSRHWIARCRASRTASAWPDCQIVAPRHALTGLPVLDLEREEELTLSRIVEVAGPRSTSTVQR